MAIADIPTKLSIDWTIKILIPGFAAFFVIFEPIVNPLIHEFWRNLEFTNKLVVFLLVSFAIGIMFMLCDSYIYNFFEGSKFWPEFLWKWKYNRMLRYFDELDKKVGNSIIRIEEELEGMSRTEFENLSLKISKLSAKIRDFAPDYEKKNFTKRYPVRPTRFGNVLYEYQNYSLNRYGIHMLVFWDHLAQLLPDRTKEEHKLEGAIADMCVYLSFISFSSIIFWFAISVIQKGLRFPFWNYLTLERSFLYVLISIIAFKLFYELSIIQHKNYGKFVKSIFDLHRIELAEKLGIEIRRDYHASRDDLKEEKALWKEYQHYYFDYGFIKGPTESSRLSTRAQECIQREQNVYKESKMYFL